MSAKFVLVTRQLPAQCLPSRLSLGTALVPRGSLTNDTSVCRLICVAIGAPYSTTNKGVVWALQRTKKHAGLPQRLSVLAIKLKLKNIKFKNRRLGRRDGGWGWQEN